MPSFSDFVHTQFLLKIPAPSASFASKTVIVTGANGGLGKEMVKHFVRLGASKVILGCRSQSRGNQAKDDIEAVTKCSPDVLEVWEVDLESAPSIKRFVDQANNLPRLDVLINNAGIRASKFKIAHDTESTLAVNNIGTFLLALQLIPKLKETAQQYGVTPHMTTVASALYDVAKYPEDHGEDIFAWFQDETHVDWMNQYNLSKLLQLHTTIKLSTIVDPTTTSNPNPVVINSVDPCFCKTGLAGELKGVLKVLFRVFEWIAARPAEEGAALVVQAAAAGRETHGLYMRAGKVQAYDSVVLDERRGEEVWDVLGRRVEGLQEGVLGGLV